MITLHYRWIALLILVGLTLAPPAMSSAASQTIRIVAFGDSNIAGKGVPSTQTYPAKLERALRAKGHDVIVTNAGINGDTTAGLLRRMDSDVPAGTHIAIVVAGANDRAAGVPESTIEANFTQIAKRLEARGMLVLSIARFQNELATRPELHVEPPGTVTNQYHLNAAGYDLVVARTLPKVLELIAKAKTPRAK